MIRLVVIVIFFATSVFHVKSSDSLFTKGISEMALENYREALEYFQKDVEANPNFSSFYNLGVAAGNVEDWFMAKWAFESALKLNPFHHDTKHNAELATRQLSPNIEWTHPYKWTNRIFLGVGIHFWLMLGFISSAFLGLYVFAKVSKKDIEPEKMEWLKRFSVIFGVILIIALIGTYKVNQHFSSIRYGVPKSADIPTFVSPNGVELDVSFPIGTRLDVEKLKTTKEWVYVKYNKNEGFWVKAESIYLY